MDTQLQSVSKLFTEKLYRIPDYQRGYAWGEKQLKEYWGDVLQLENEKNHYVGVLTLEEVSSHIYETWEDDLWIIKSKSFKPYFVVDGQQRLTTTVILLQAITESVSETSKLNFNTIQEIRKRFIFDSKDDGISRSYIFGYEKDNPSCNFLKKNIFREKNSDSYIEEETIYTLNLYRAKNFFIERLQELNKADIENIFTKITQRFLFNIYTISSDIDVFVAFETMNNRGKPLSHLELLKNRLIYLSTKFDVKEYEQQKLRRTVNDCWKALYHVLGKNKEKPLDDDLFLLNHTLRYFGPEFFKAENRGALNRIYIERFRKDYPDFLLENKFTPKNIDTKTASKKLSVKNIYEYASDLQASILVWYDIFNPASSNKFNDEEKLYLTRIHRLGINSVLPLLLDVYSSETPKERSVIFLSLLERLLFVSIFFHRFNNQSEFYDMVLQHSKKKDKIGSYINTLIERNKVINKYGLVEDRLIDSFRRGFYKWEAIRYLLYEYELSLKGQTKTARNKIDWNELNKESSDYITVEHIYPQNASADCWSVINNHYSASERQILADSLGNLLPLSTAKNSSLQNICFKTKVDRKDGLAGYRYGSYSEIEVSQCPDWTAQEILKRGVKLLEFVEKRWAIKLGDYDQKVKILRLRFVK
ncbi:uncharacterized protein with ParB-like and HNH nuclease domain [Spirosoma lacussanchae]|uniref:DUF262 domain-containing protein n=1 Tax=Spirosoma lacussanchae TaxID=1884249 RepID=UPI001107E330|nr:DUF262 domain-containing protein [Spirosoma lacussanchae]